VEDEVEITGPMALKLWLSSSTTDADLFVSMGILDPEGHEATFIGTNDPRTPIGLGWLRASHRKTDPVRSTPYRPFHTHDEAAPLVPGEPVELDVEIWPSCIVIPAGYTLGFSVRGNDYRYDGELSDFAKTFRFANRGVGPFTHADPDDRPADVFGAPVTLISGGAHDSYVLVPIIPSSDASH
jgi:predicted acyl esterase